MNLTTLNKAVAVFVIGGLALAWICVRGLTLIPTNLVLTNPVPANSLLKDSAVALGLIATILAICVGATIDAFTDVLRTFAERPWLHRAIENWLEKGKICVLLKPLRWPLWLFWPREQYKDYLEWNCHFERIFQKSGYRETSLVDTMSEEPKKDAPTDKDKEDRKREVNRKIAAGILLKHASPQQIEWLSSTYSTRILYSNVCVIVILTWSLECIYAIFSSSADRFSTSSLAIAFVFIVLVNLALWARMLDSHFYSYMLAFRFSFFHCQEEMAKAAAPPKPAGEAGAKPLP